MTGQNGKHKPCGRKRGEMALIRQKGLIETARGALWPGAKRIEQIDVARPGPAPKNGLNGVRGLLASGGVPGSIDEAAAGRPPQALGRLVGELRGYADSEDFETYRLQEVNCGSQAPQQGLGSLDFLAVPIEHPSVDCTHASPCINGPPTGENNARDTRPISTKVLLNRAEEILARQSRLRWSRLAAWNDARKRRASAPASGLSLM